MNASAAMNATTAVNASVSMNTEFRDSPPDVDAYDGPLKRRCLDLVARLAAHELTVDQYQAEVRTVFADATLGAELAPSVARAIAERKDQVFYRKQEGSRRVTLQLLYLAPREVHPPHCHHNLISNQMNVSGRCDVREFDRVARLSPDTLLVRLVQDRSLGVGDLMQTTEVHRNAHWFAADGEPCVVLNFYLLGYQSWTFDPIEPTRRKGRQLLDPTAGVQDDGLLIAKEVDFATGYAKFGQRRLADFPLPAIGLQSGAPS